MAEYTYNGRNQLSTTKVENGLFTATQSYDDAGRLWGRSSVAPSTGALDTTAYTLSPDGRRTGITRNGTAETYGYDSARQVESASIPLTGGTRTNGYQYDAAGNRSTATTNGTTTSYFANLLNGYTSWSGGILPPSHDANGNQLTTYTGATLAWDINNQLTSASNSAGDTATYEYDALGRRTKRNETISGVTTSTWFLTNGWNVELEYENGAYARRLTWGMDLSQTLQGAGGVGGLVMLETQISSSPIPNFPLYDGNGNITAWVNSSGTVTARQRYDAFGNIIEQTGTAPSRYGFSTKPIDLVTGFLYYGYRFYDPKTGRWPSRDPIGEQGGINLYGFVGNSGVNGVDLYGLNELIISGGCNAHKGGWDGAAQASDGILGDPLRRGIRKVNPGIAHDRNWKNFITAAEKEIEERKGKLAKGEQIEWFVEWHSYARRAQLEGLDVNAYRKEIQEIAKKHEVALRFYGSKMEFIGKLHTSVFGNGYRTGNEKISRLTYFGHGRPGSFDFVYPGNQNGYSLFNEDIGMISKEVFSNHAIAISCACNSATATEGGGKSFRDVWKDHFGWEFYGVNSRTSYFKPESPTPTEGGNWVPSPPDGFE